MNAPVQMLGDTLTLEDQPAAQGALAERPAMPLAPQTRDDIMLMAMQRGYTPDQIAQMMDLRDRQDRYVGEKAFREAFAAFRGENVIVPKTKEVDRGKAGTFVQAEYHIASNLLSPALSRHGFGFRHDQKFGSRTWKTDGVENDVPWVWVTCYLEHRAGHSEKLELEGPPGDLSANTPTQNMQVTASYLKRQSLLAITGTATGGEDDENKMKRGAGATTDAGGAPQKTLIDAGNAAAMNGLSALTAWWRERSGREQKELQRDYGSMRRAAQAADKGVHHDQ